MEDTWEARPPWNLKTTKNHTFFVIDLTAGEFLRHQVNFKNWKILKILQSLIMSSTVLNPVFGSSPWKKIFLSLAIVSSCIILYLPVLPCIPLYYPVSPCITLYSIPVLCHAPLTHARSCDVLYCHVCHFLLTKQRKTKQRNRRVILTLNIVQT